MSIKIGILGLHGSREEHAQIMKDLGCETVFLRKEEDFKNIDGIILPGGESSSFGRLLNWSGIHEQLIDSIINKNIPTFGTCAGSILLASKGSEYCINALGIEVSRNAYGRQVDSFSDDIEIKGDVEKFHALFIRAPKIENITDDIEILSEYNGSPVLVRSKTTPRMVATFHPELTNDSRIHQIFLEMIEHNIKK